MNENSKFNERTFTIGDESITVHITNAMGVTRVYYHIDDIEEPISKALLRKMQTEIGDFTFITNAGLELHSSEVKNGMWEGITIKRK